MDNTDLYNKITKDLNTGNTKQVIEDEKAMLNNLEEFENLATLISYLQTLDQTKQPMIRGENLQFIRKCDIQTTDTNILIG